MSRQLALRSGKSPAVRNTSANVQRGHRLGQKLIDENSNIFFDKCARSYGSGGVVSDTLRTDHLSVNFSFFYMTTV